MNQPSASTPQQNRLARETSPYLLQHACNPVDWYPWGDEAFAKSRNENKPIFLSVGYSACHWCHVMEHESFENEAIAALLNEHFVSIKVDREERPDVDQIYMSAVQLITRRGGWPMSVFLTSEGKPFYGGTYWPPTSRMGMPGFREILLKLADYWHQKRDEVDESAEQLADAMQRLAIPEFEQAELGESLLRNALQQLLKGADRRHGGFGGAPKFPQPMAIRMLLRCWKRFGEQDALDVAILTLDKMARGGIYDHLGGGFHRYSTDAVWLAPHFEKMLYDNALLVPAYLEAFQATGDQDLATVVRETLEYVLREMTSPEGGFFSTQDADSEGEEGKFFVWTEDEIDEVLDADEASVFKPAYGVTPQGNWEGRTILNRSGFIKSGPAPAKPSEDLLIRSREKLLAHRSQRVKPGRDEKILVSWNGMMISAMSQAGLVLAEERYVAAARNAANFILSRICDERGRLLHSFKDGRARFQAYLDDYACLIDGLTDLYQASNEEQFLVRAVELADEMLASFGDSQGGGLFFTATDHEKLIARTKDHQDNAVPSGNGMAATALLKLSRLCARADFEQRAVEILESLGGMLSSHPQASGQLLMACDFLLGPAYEIVIAEVKGDSGSAGPLEAALHQEFLPNKVVAHWRENPSVGQEILAGKSPDDATVQAWVCDRGRCFPPVTSASELRSQLFE